MANSEKSGETENRSKGCSRYTAPGNQTSVPKLQEIAMQGPLATRLRPAQPAWPGPTERHMPPGQGPSSVTSAGVAKACGDARHGHQQGLLQRAVQSGFATARTGQQLGLQAVQRVQVGVAQADELQGLGAVSQ